MATFSVTVDARPNREQTDGTQRVYLAGPTGAETGSGVDPGAVDRGSNTPISAAGIR